MAVERLTAATINSTGEQKLLTDAVNIVCETFINGFYQLTFKLYRPLGAVYDDIGLNFQALALSPRGDKVWEGRIVAIEPGVEGVEEVIVVTAAGYWTAAYDSQNYNGTLGPNTPEALLGLLLSGGYLPQWSTSTALLVTTGRINDKYQTGGTATDDEFPGDIIKAICAWGDSTQRRVIPAIWENRVLQTYAVNMSSPAADYIVRRQYVFNVGSRQSLDEYANQIMVRYKDNTIGPNYGNLTRVVLDNSTAQAALGITYPGTGSKTNFVKRRVIDYTGLNEMSSTVASNNANTVLNEVSRIRTTSKDFSIATDYCVYEVASGQEIPLWKVRAGKFIQIPDLINRASLVGSGSTSGDASLQNTFFISHTALDQERGVLTISPENAGTLTESYN